MTDTTPEPDHWIPLRGRAARRALRFGRGEHNPDRPRCARRTAKDRAGDAKAKQRQAKRNKTHAMRTEVAA